MIFFSSIHLPSNFMVSLILLAEIIHSVNVHFLYLFLSEENLGCFKFLTITNKAAVNIVEHMTLR